MKTGVLLYFLGSARVERNGMRVAYETRKAQALLVYLVVTGTPQARDVLATMFWPENNQASARGALRRTLSTLKASLPEDFLVISREQIGIAPEAPYWCDLSEFRKLLEIAHLHSHPAEVYCQSCKEAYETAVLLYNGNFLSGFTLRDSPGFDDWQYYQAEQLHSQFTAALFQLVRIYSSGNEFEKAINIAQRWLAIDPLREEAHQQLMLLYYWAGQRSAALQEYRKCVRTLAEELGVAPLEETTELYHAILEGKAPQPPERVESPINSQPAQDFEPGILPSKSEPNEGASAPIFPLVGRSRETEVLYKIYNTKAGTGHLIILKGEPGIGKTRLAEDFLTYAKRRGAKLLTARCYAGEKSLAYAPFTDALMAAEQMPQLSEKLGGLPDAYLQQAARLYPDFAKLLNQHPPDRFSHDPATELLFHEGIRQVIYTILKGQTPGIFFIDDCQWADEASIQQLAYMAHRLGGNPILILITISDETLSDRLNLLINESQRSGVASVLKIGRLLPTDLQEVVRLINAPMILTNQQLAMRIYRETEGLPFFVVEYLQAYLANAKPDENDPAVAWPMPGNVQNLLQSRLDGLDDTTWQILTTAAIIGRSFDYDVLLEASGRSEVETISGIEKLLARRLIEQVGGIPGQSSEYYDFTHDKVREFVYDQTNPTRRRLLHRRAAEALSRQNRGKIYLSGLTSQIALHYQQAGLEHEAAEYYRAAGDHARSVFANREAIDHYQAALSLGHPLSADLHEATGDLQVWLGDYKSAISSYLAATAFNNEASQARLEHKLGSVHHRRGEWDLANQYYQTAVEQSEARLDNAELADIYIDWSQSSYRQGRIEEANYFARQSYTLIKDTQQHEIIAKAANMLGILARATGDPKTAHTWFETSLETARIHQDYSAEIAARNNLALLLTDEGNYITAIETVQGALDLCQKIGDRHHEAALLNHLAEIFHAIHDEEKAMEYLKMATQIFVEIGGSDELPNPEIWMLSEW